MPVLPLLSLVTDCLMVHGSRTQPCHILLGRSCEEHPKRVFSEEATYGLCLFAWKGRPASWWPIADPSVEEMMRAEWKKDLRPRFRDSTFEVVSSWFVIVQPYHRVIARKPRETFTRSEDRPFVLIQ